MTLSSFLPPFLPPMRHLYPHHTPLRAHLTFAMLVAQDTLLFAREEKFFHHVGQSARVFRFNNDAICYSIICLPRIVALAFQPGMGEACRQNEGADV